MKAKRILVVDDDADIREVMTWVLESEGFEVSELDNGLAVTHTVDERRPDLILLDIQLGDSDGRDICRELKQRSETHGIPIIMVSASHNWSSLHEKQCNADDFLAKPFDIGEFIERVRRFAA